MAKFLKKYDKEKGEWVLVSAPDISVQPRFEDGSKMTDSNVRVTNPSYAEPDKEVMLDDTLDTIHNDISELRRNVSWLAKHGGNGGSGGGGSTTSYGICIISPVIDSDKRAYVNSSTFELEFMISGGTEGDICTFTYEYDSERQTDPEEIAVNTSVKKKFDNTGSKQKEHSIIIRATNPFGNTIAAVSFKIYESTLSLVFDKETAGKDYENGILNISRNGQGYIPLLMTNGMMGSVGTIVAQCLSETKAFAFTGTTTETEKKTIVFWDIIEKSSVETGQQFVVTFNSTATLGTNTAKSEEFQLRIRIINPSELTLSIGINGQDSTEEDIEAPINSVVNYNFKAYAPVSIDNVYYSAKLKNLTSGREKLILGRYYDDTLKEPGANSYLDNSYARKENVVISQFTMADDEGFFNEGDIINLCIKAWGTGTASLSTENTDGKITAIKEVVEVFPRQYSRRDGNPGTGDVLFASWNSLNANPVYPEKWTSKVTNYNFIDDTLRELENSAVTLDLNMYNGNSSSGIKTQNSIAYLRLQNHAYAISNFGKYYNEMKLIAASSFTVSITVNADVVTDTLHTIFLWGTNNAENELSNGFRIDSDKIYWAINELTAEGNRKLHLLTCNFSSNNKNSIDFVYDGKSAKIYVNGTLNAAVNIYSFAFVGYYLPQQVYFGVNEYNGSLYNYSDVNVYDFSIYTKALNDLQIVVNSKSWRLNGPISDAEVKLDYNKWMKRNFIEHNSVDEKIPVSTFYSNGNFKNEFTGPEIRDIAVKSSIPTLYLNFDSASNFTEKYFHDKHTSEVTKEKYSASAYYYAPSESEGANGKWLDNFKVKIALQGTSTLGYRIKNLELYVDEYITVQGVEVPKLFQPKKEWFPEQEFTLKADVVDSAHANNAVLGEWINNCGLMEPNLAMQNFGVNTRPKDVNEYGEPQQHRSGTEMIDYDEDVQIKHTLEGFPILIFIKFSEKTNYDFIGIYSFNLGRYSYYNMGMKFLKNFSRWNKGIKDACPALINYYEETENLGNVRADNIFSFEFGNAGNLKIKDYPVWTQYDKSVIKTYGEFRYPENVTDQDGIWTNLCSLFENVAKTLIDDYYGDPISTFSNVQYNNIYKYTIDNDGNYHNTGDKIQTGSDTCVAVSEKLNLNNAAAYFVIANAFGMTDSLGKNLTLRTWDGGETWYTCFYDMDTALGLTNDGAEDVPVTVSIDKVTMTSNPQTQTTTTGMTYHYEESKFAAVYSKLWGILRDGIFLYEVYDSRSAYLYEPMWARLRQKGGKLAKASNFTDIMENRINTCGELIYDYDYNSKYINDNNEQEEGVASAINFLHGTRIEFVKSWLTKHFYFLDGMFNASRIKGTTYTYEDSPFNSDIFTVSVVYDGAIKQIPFTVRATTPAFIGMQIGNDAYKNFYIEEANKDTLIYLSNNSSSNSQLNIKGSSLLSSIDGLQGGFQNMNNTSSAGVLRSLTSLNVSNSSRLTENPFSGTTLIYNENSALETINLQGTKGDNVLATYEVDLEKMNKLLNVNISNSQVKNLVLPKTSLLTLNIASSNISSFEMSAQNILSAITFDGCNKLGNISLDNCSAIKTLTVENKPLLTSLNVVNCHGLEEITISNNFELNTINIWNNANLKKIKIDTCGDKNIQISIKSCPLESIVFNNLEVQGIVELPAKEYLTNITTFKIINCYDLDCVQYGEEEIETYNEQYVWDISAFENLDTENFSLRNAQKIHYLRVKNIEDNPFRLIGGVFTGNSELKRIFGHISIEEPGIFGSLKKFYLNEPTDEYPSVDFVPTSVDRYYTNLTINTESLANCFSMTKCTLSDVYYILQKCDNVISLEYTFYGADVKLPATETLDNRLFTHCTKVETIDGIFMGCEFSGFVSPDIWKIDGEINPMMTKITSFVEVFGGMPKMINTTTPFFPEGNNIETIKSFNPTSSARFRDSKLLSNLSKLKSLDNSFNECSIDFTMGEEDRCDLFIGTPNIETISNSFNKVVGVGSLKGIFDGCSKLKNVLKSFSFDSSSSNPRGINGGRSVLLPLGNSFMASIKNTIEHIANNVGENSSYCDVFTGGVYKYIDMEDCVEGENFPYDIFDGCAELKEIPHFFDKLHFERLPDDESDIISVSLPGRLFANCPKLTNLAYAFANINSSITYTLESNGFKNNALINIESIFEDGNKARTGEIPYHLFYQEIEKESHIEGMSLEQATSSGLKSMYDRREEILEEIEGEITEEERAALMAELEVLNEQIIAKEATIIPSVEEYTYKTDNKTIEKANNLFKNSSSTGITSYHAIINDWTDLVEPNENFSTFAYVFKDGGYVKNTENFKYKWNKFIFDNSTDFYEYIDPSSTKYTGIFEARDEYGNPVVDADKVPDEFKPGFVQKITSPDLIMADTGYNITGPASEVFLATNYICAPDIFRSCISTISISGTFYNCGGGFDRNNKFEGGLFGKIPGFIFEPIKDTIGLDNIFASCQGILPNKWGGVDEEGELVLGETYPANIFKGLNYVYSLNGIFRDTRIWGRTQIPATLFNDCESLTSVSSLWENTKWISRKDDGFEIYQIPTNLFSSCGKMSNIGSMLGGSNIYMMSEIFTPNANPNLTNCASFLRGDSNAKGILPEFWRWSRTQLVLYKEAYFGITPENISNYNEENFKRFMQQE